MIFICEPQCIGFEHAEVNAALLAVLQGAFPQEEFHFFAELEHMERVRSSLERHRALNCRIFFHEIDVPSRNKSSARRFPRELAIYRYLFQRARECAVKKVLFASITGSGLAAIKLLLPSIKGISCVVVLHNSLISVSRRPPLWPAEMPFWLKLWMVTRNTGQVQYVVLSPVVQEDLIRLLPSVRAQTHSIHMPCFFSDRTNLTPLQGPTIRFGAFGVGRTSKGTQCFFKLAEDVQRTKTAYRAEFIVVGYLMDQSLVRAHNDSVAVPFQQNGPADRDMYDIYAQQIHYAVYLYDPATYRLTASAALYDAFYYVKPIIALKHPLFEYYFEKMGDIGFLCESYRELRTAVEHILTVQPSDQYALQQQNILRGRRQFSISALSELVSDIWPIKAGDR